MSKYVIITDLDGCLIDKTYDYRKSLKAIEFIKKHRIPFIMNTSKTRSEVEVYLNSWRIMTPFAVENGAALYMPSEIVYNAKTMINTLEDYRPCIIGLKREDIERKISDLVLETKGKAIWLQDMTPKVFSDITGLPVDLAIKALQREYSSLFHPVDKAIVGYLLDKLGQRGLSASTGSGKVYIVTGRHDKGDILRLLIEKGIIEQDYKTICLGDGFNDIPMLKICDIPILLGGNRRIAEEIGRDDLIFVEERGPDVWLKVVKKVIGF